MKPTEVFYDLGSGDASLLIYVVQQCGLKKAIGFENMESRVRKARLKIKEAGLEKIIESRGNMYGADLSKADVILDMMPEGKNDYRLLYAKSSHFKNGTKLIRHDLPLIGYLPDKIDLPFYLMQFPLHKAAGKNEWASSVLGEPNTTANQLWHELYYYGYEKSYSKGEILQFDSMLSARLRH